MKIYFPKIILLLFLMMGIGAGLSMYDKVLLLTAGIIRTIGNSWLLTSILFVVSLTLAKSGVRYLVNELSLTTTFDKIDLLRIAKFFIAGFIGCFLAFSVVGTFLLTIYLVIKYFLIL